MRRVSRTNSHKHKSRDTIADYCERFDYDEPLYWLGVRLTSRGLLIECERNVDHGNDFDRRLELNHVWTNPRADIRSNFCRMLKPGHDWFHANLSAGRMICVLTKLRKMESIGEPEEFDLTNLNATFGRFVDGCIANYRFVDPLLVRLNDECLERLHRLQTSVEAR